MTTLQEFEKQVQDTIERTEEQFDRDRTFGDRLADDIARFGGSWTFIGWMIALLVVWITLNSLTLFHFIAFDPFPFILLNLCLSFLAGFQAPVIMMSQNRASKKDRYYNEQQFKNIYIMYLEMQEINSRLGKFDLLFQEVDDLSHK